MSSDYNMDDSQDPNASGQDQTDGGGGEGGGEENNEADMIFAPEASKPGRNAWSYSGGPAHFPRSPMHPESFWSVEGRILPHSAREDPSPRVGRAYTQITFKFEIITRGGPRENCSLIEVSYKP